MQKTTHNPTPWLTHFGLNHGVEVTGGARTLYLSGQTASDAEGEPLHAGDIVAQYGSAWQNLMDALASAGMDASNLVRLNFYTTDVPAFMEAAEPIKAKGFIDAVQAWHVKADNRGRGLQSGRGGASEGGRITRGAP